MKRDERQFRSQLDETEDNSRPARESFTLMNRSVLPCVSPAEPSPFLSNGTAGGTHGSTLRQFTGSKREIPFRRILTQTPVAADVSPLHLIRGEVRANSRSLLRIKLSLQAGHPNVGWKKKDADGLDIWVDRGSGFIFLATDTEPDYLDTAALPAPGASAVWKYKAIYKLNDEQVGQWSDVASISVMG